MSRLQLLSPPQAVKSRCQDLTPVFMAARLDPDTLSLSVSGPLPAWLPSLSAHLEFQAECNEIIGNLEILLADLTLLPVVFDRDRGEADVRQRLYVRSYYYESARFEPVLSRYLKRLESLSFISSATRRDLRSLIARKLRPITEPRNHLSHDAATWPRDIAWYQIIGSIERMGLQVVSRAPEAPPLAAGFREHLASLTQDLTDQTNAIIDDLQAFYSKAAQDQLAPEA